MHTVLLPYCHKIRCIVLLSCWRIAAETAAQVVLPARLAGCVVSDLLEAVESAAGILLEAAAEGAAGREARCSSLLLLMEQQPRQQLLLLLLLLLLLVGQT